MHQVVSVIITASLRVAQLYAVRVAWRCTQVNPPFPSWLKHVVEEKTNTATKSFTNGVSNCSPHVTKTRNLSANSGRKSTSRTVTIRIVNPKILFRSICIQKKSAKITLKRIFAQLMCFCLDMSWLATPFAVTLGSYRATEATGAALVALQESEMIFFQPLCKAVADKPEWWAARLGFCLFLISAIFYWLIISKLFEI